MTCSSLAAKSNISPNTSGWRGAPSKITIHHTAGVCSADALGWIFADPGRQASCNYGIGDDGEIICILEEEYWPWTSSSGENDSRAVTLEVSNCEAGGDWPIGGAAWDSMIRLVADVCTRWGIEPYYDGTPYGTFTEHRMFAATGCPGPYIHDRMYQIVEEVRAAMNGGGGEWKQDEKGWWYKYSGGGYPCEKWEKINGKWYYFDGEGYMATGWLWYSGAWYYLQPRTEKTGDSFGHMVTGWKTIKWRGKSCKFYFQSSGAMFPGGFHEVGGKWYAFDSNGVVVTDDAAVAVDKNGRITIKDVA